MEVNMELVQKGSSVDLDTIKALKATLTWHESCDFDLAALYEMKDGSEGIIYFNNKGDLNTSPFIKVGEDAGVGDTVDGGAGGENQETLKMTKLDENIKTIHLICWDWGQIQNGGHARFAESDVKLSIVDDSGNNHDVKLDCGDMGNVVIVATIDNSSPIGAKFINTSKAGTLKGLKDSKQLLEIARA
jgi:uncharacterized protein involved in tellurium resistance